MRMFRTTIVGSAMLLTLALTGTAAAEGDKYSSESSYGSSSSSDTGGTSPIQSNCIAIDSTGNRVPGVWVPRDDVTSASAAEGRVPEVETIKNYREFGGM